MDTTSTTSRQESSEERFLDYWWLDEDTKVLATWDTSKYTVEQNNEIAEMELDEQRSMATYKLSPVPLF